MPSIGRSINKPSQPKAEVLFWDPRNFTLHAALAASNWLRGNESNVRPPGRYVNPIGAGCLVATDGPRGPEGRGALRFDPFEIADQEQSKVDRRWE
jgi:hypothetical protein